MFRFGEIYIRETILEIPGNTCVSWGKLSISMSRVCIPSIDLTGGCCFCGGFLGISRMKAGGFPVILR